MRPATSNPTKGSATGGPSKMPATSGSMIDLHPLQEVQLNCKDCATLKRMKGFNVQRIQYNGYRILCELSTGLTCPCLPKQFREITCPQPLIFENEGLFLDNFETNRSFPAPSSSLDFRRSSLTTFLSEAFITSRQSSGNPLKTRTPAMTTYNTEFQPLP